LLKLAGPRTLPPSAGHFDRRTQLGSEGIEQLASAVAHRRISERCDQQQSRFGPFKIAGEDCASVFEVTSSSTTSAIDRADAADWIAAYQKYYEGRKRQGRKAAPSP